MKIIQQQNRGRAHLGKVKKIKIHETHTHTQTHIKPAATLLMDSDEMEWNKQTKKTHP